MMKARVFAFGAAVGAALGYLFDPERGRRRRHAVRERSTATARRVVRRIERRSRASTLHAIGHTRGVLHRLRPSAREPLDDAGLAHKVESVLYRDRSVPKGRISINAEDGTVFLRGELDDAVQIEDVATAVRRIPGVGGVVNLLHPVGTATV